jgi:MurNAc alpha-1-phosphate uridylyltransferase
MLLAAGRGERMRPLTDVTPKPLLKVQGVPLLQLHMQALLAAGVRGPSSIPAGWGRRFPRISAMNCAAARWGREREATALLFGGAREAFETAGGISRALPQLGRVFWLAAGDVYAPDFSFAAQAAQAFAQSDELAHLWLVPNPAHNPRGDFGLSEEGAGPACRRWAPRYTYSTIALLKAELFASPGSMCSRATPKACASRWHCCCAAPCRRPVGASLYTGRWVDVGTPERLAQLNQ